MISLAGLLRNMTLQLQVTGYAPCPICKVGRLERPTGETLATCNNCGTVLA